jgi:rSAM/selenodomain-associated transferase 2/rSAM/selenodomain-associated transferase 1
VTDATLCIFAKPPVAGSAKTRLAAELGAERAAALARAFLVDTCGTARARPWARPILATTGELEPALRAELALPVWQQGDGDLGARMEHVLVRALTETPIAIAVGADSPGLPPRLLDAAWAALATADAVIGPADDGGFYLLGLRRCPAGLLADLPWSAPDTRACTVDRLRAHGMIVRELAPWFDVDRAEDLTRLHRLLDTGAIVAPATRRLLGAPRVSIVMPVLDEARRITGALDDVLALVGRKEVIVVDGGSRDDTLALARTRPVRVVESTRGRACQMNAGAMIAAGDVLMFLHADTTLPAEALALASRVLDDPDVIAGAFRTWTVADPPDVPWFAPLLHLADLRSRYTSLPYGDQALFVRADVFRQVGGFPDQPLMEDLELARRLRRRGRIVTVPARVRVSGRRFVARPLFHAVVMNAFPALYRLGVSPDRLATLYRSIR